MAIAGWKLKREIRRILAQAAQLPGDIDSYLFATRRYDTIREGAIRQFSGEVPVSKRIVIFLIFPSRGLEKSHLRTLEYFRRKGYAPFVVSNVPIDEADRSRLLEHCWSYMERPNFGYDFGGYRDAILSLKDDLEGLERLVIFNDSTWFPLPGGKDWLDEVEALDVDFAGAASNYGTPRPTLEAFRSIKWNYDASHRNFHYCSFALCLRPTVFRHSEFLNFWRRLRMSDKKKRTVRRGEIGFTQWALSCGFAHGGALDVSNLDRELEALTDARLFETAENLIIPEDPRLEKLVSQIVSGSEPARSDLIKLILLAVSRQGASYALAAYSTKELGFPFLKKSPISLSANGREITLKLLEEMAGAEEFLAEAKALAVRKGAMAQAKASAEQGQIRA